MSISRKIHLVKDIKGVKAKHSIIITPQRLSWRVLITYILYMLMHVPDDLHGVLDGGR